MSVLRGKRVIVLGLLVSGCAPRPAPVGEAPAPIIGGMADQGDPAVVEFDSRCTAVLISPHVLLTAGHCVEDPTAKTSIFTGPIEGKPGRTVPVKELHRHPSYDPMGGTNARH